MNLAAIRWALWALLGVVLVVTIVGVWLAGRPEMELQPPPVLGKVPSFELINRDGRSVTDGELRGRVWVANFIFTRCALSCPKMTSHMMRVGESLPEGVSISRVSFTVDPDYDSPEVLADYAASYSVRDPDWLFLSGDREAIERVTVEGFKLPIVRDPPDGVVDPREPILHSDRFVLVDGWGRIRGYYEPAVREGYEKLMTDIVLVSEEGTMSPPPEVLTEAAAREIEGLHAFFGGWFLGELPATDAIFERLSLALADDFWLIGPAGGQFGRAEILESIRAAHGTRAETGFEIWIDDIRARPAPEGYSLMTYREWQRSRETTRVRMSSVLFRANAAAPNGVEWLHLHETWLPTEETK